MKLPTTLALTVLLFGAGALLSVPTGCTTCNAIGCNSGFQWEAAAQDGSPLMAGDYQLSVTLDGATYEVTCTLPAERPLCGPVAAPVGGRFTVEVYLATNYDDELVRGFYLHAVDSGATERSGGLGPETVEIAVRFAGAPLFTVDYDEVEYEVDEDYWGDPRCGACELQEERSYTW